jgi:hypothetical protein
MGERVPLGFGDRHGDTAVTPLQLKGRLYFYETGHGGRFFVSDGDPMTIIVRFHVCDISEAWAFASRQLEKAGLKAELTPMLGEKLDVDRVALSSLFKMELRHYAYRHNGRFHADWRITPRTIFGIGKIFADFEVDEGMAEDWLGETISTFGLQATALSWRFLNQHARDHISKGGEVISG